MDFMKADSGALKLKLTTGDIVDHSKNIFEKFKLAAKEKNIEYSFKTEVPAFEIEFDRHYMEIVLSNLLSNAIKFVPANGRVMMGLNMSVNHVEVCICDNGPGIPENDAENIFTKFFQVNPESEKKKGSGIGLMLSKKLMELHGGSIAFKREPLAGFTEEHTCFIVYLRKDNNAFPI